MKKRNIRLLFLKLEKLKSLKPVCPGLLDIIVLMFKSQTSRLVLLDALIKLLFALNLRFFMEESCVKLKYDVNSVDFQMLTLRIRPAVKKFSDEGKTAIERTELEPLRPNSVAINLYEVEFQTFMVLS